MTNETVEHARRRKRLNVLYLVRQDDPDLDDPWAQQLLQDTLAAVGNSHHVRLVDFNAPMPPQFDGVDVVIDHGGLMGTREMMNCAERVWRGRDSTMWI